MNSSKPNRILAALILSIPFGSSAEDKNETPVLPATVVTATRGATPAEQVGSAVTVITGEQIEKTQKTDVADLLRTVPGLDVVRSGGSGQQVSVFLRGTESNHVLVLIDGIEATDPSNPTNQFDFAGLAVDDIERIEVVRGPQSTLYGSDAIGGVVQIFTRRGTSARNRVQLETGRYGSHAARGGLHGGDAGLNYGVTFNLSETDGVSAFPNGDEDDAYDNKTLAAHVSAQPTEVGTLDFTLRRVEFDTDIDAYDSVTFLYGDDPDARLHTEQWLARLQGGYALLDGRWNQRLGLSWTDYDRSNRNGPAPVDTFPGASRFKGRKTKLDWAHDFRVDDAHQLTFGLESEKEEAELSGNQDPDTGNDAIFLQDHIRVSDAFFATVGLRHDRHDDFGGETTWRLAPVYVLRDTGTRLRASYGTGFKAPSLSELFESFPPFFFANPDLEPERSKGWDLGVEQRLLDDRLQLELTYFRNDIEDLITVDPVSFSTLVNLNEATTKGYELGLRYQWSPALALGAGYTHTRARDEASGQDLVRRPRKKANLYADWQATPQLQLGLTGRYVGERDDFDANFTPVEADSYTLFEARLAYTLTPAWAVFGRIENAFDQDYEEIPGFGTPGRALYAGLRFTP